MLHARPAIPARPADTPAPSPQPQLPVQSLEQPRGRSASTGPAPAVFAPFPVPFVELPMPEFSRVAPPNGRPGHRAFWLMRLLRQSILQGATVSERLFVPRAVWTQPGVGCPHGDAKTAAWQELLRGLERVSACSVTSTNELAQVVATFCGTLSDIQHTLSTHLDYVQDSDAGRVRRATEGGLTFGERLRAFARTATQAIAGSPAHEGDSTQYAELLGEVCRQAQFLDEWLGHYEQFDETPILKALRRASAFFEHVFCPVALSDLHFLLEMYIHGAGESLYKLAP